MFKFLKGTERFLEKIVDIVFALVLLIGLYYAYDSLFVLHKAEATEVMTYRPTESEPSAYKDLSKDCVGWITIYNSGVDFPIMQGKDNMEYLNKDAFGAYALTGSIFLDSRNDPHFADPYSLIHGHHVAAGKMFGALDAFADEKYFDEHRKGELVYDGKLHKIETFAFGHTDASEGLIFDPSRDGDRLEWVRDNCEIKKEPAGSRILAMATCTTPASTKRTILIVSILD